MSQQIPQQLIQAEIQRRNNLQEFEKCKGDKYYWLTNYVWTLDPHDKVSPIKKFPAKEYIRILVGLWETEPLLMIEKSRQMMMTWLMCSLSVHEAQFNEGRHIFVQSKKEDDANTLVERCKFIYHQQPDFLKHESTDEVYCKLKFPGIHSKIVGIPQGGDQIRMHTATIIFSDEIAFQPEAEDAFAAAKPCIEGGGSFVGVSTANPGFFADICQEKGEIIDILDEHPRGVYKKYTEKGFCIASLHYTADPRKATQEWKENAQKGLNEDKWKKEYEIDYSALGGMKVYPEIDRKEMFVNPFPIPDHWEKYVGIDPGVRNPTSCHFYAIDELGNIYAYWELYEKELHYKNLALILKGHEDWEKIKSRIFIDPIVATKVHHTGSGIKSFKDLLEEEKIFTIPGIRDRFAGAERIREYIVDKKLKIFKTCPKLMEELENLRYSEWVGDKSLKNPREEIVSRNDHAWSDLRYFLMSNPAKTKKKITGIEAKIKKMKREQKSNISNFYRI